MGNHSVSGLDPWQLWAYVVQPVLLEFSKARVLSDAVPYSEEAGALVLGTAIHESAGLVYIDQKDKANKPGPAYGLWQIESLTYMDLWGRVKPALREKLMHFSLFPEPDAKELHGNLFLGAAMCRTFYRLLPDRIPSDPAGMAALWKLRYNTYLGAGTVEQALPAFELAYKVAQS